MLKKDPTERKSSTELKNFIDENKNKFQMHLKKLIIIKYY